jgi:hypothetical protein
MKNTKYARLTSSLTDNRIQDLDEDSSALKALTTYQPTNVETHNGMTKEMVQAA